MRALLSVAAICMAVVAAHAAEYPRLVLWDFENDAPDWWANPWSGGRIIVTRGVEGRYGKAIRGTWQDVPGAGNLVSGMVRDLPHWRDGDWTTITFWLKGDGERGSCTLQVLGEQPDGKGLVYSANVPLDSKDWRHFVLDIRTFWNREGIRYKPEVLRRILFSSTANRVISVDQVALEGPQVEIPLEMGWSGISLSRSAEWLIARWDPGDTPADALPQAVELKVTWPSGGLGKARREVTRPLADDCVLPVPYPPETGMTEAVLNMIWEGAMPRVTGMGLQFRASTTQPAPEPVEALLPAPKRFEYEQGGATFRTAPRMFLHAAGPEEVTQPVREYLAGQLAQRVGITCELPAPKQSPPGDPALVWMSADENADPLPAQLDLPADEGPEAYALQVGPDCATVAASARPGLRYGAITLLQLLCNSVAPGGHPVPACKVADWPSFPVRAISIPLPTDRWGYPNDAPVDPGFWEQYLLRTCLENKLNAVVILVRQGMKYKRHPELDGPAAWDQDTVRRIVATLKAHDIEPIPLLDSLGHANWLVINAKQLREDGDTNTLCTRHPDAKPYLLDCYEEVIDVFQPRHFHMGLDEIRWQTYNKPEAERCPLCKGLDKREVFREWVEMLCAFLKERDIRPMMWGDMVLPRHGGGTPFHLDDTLPGLPKEIIITNWSTTLDPVSNHTFRKLGFEVIQSNSEGVTPAQAPDVIGNMFGVWNKLPWLTDNAVGPGKAVSYSFLPQLVGAEYGWNIYPDPTVIGVPVAPDFFAARMGALTRLAMDAPVGKVTAVAVCADAFGNPVVGEKAEGVRVLDVPLSPDPGQGEEIAVGRAARGIIALVAADVPDDQEEAFYKRLRDKMSWPGLPVGELVVRYEDGSRAVRPLMFGYDLRDCESVGLPFACHAVGYHTDETGRTWYGVQWVNPEPKKTVAKVEFRALETEARVMLKALSVYASRVR